MLDPFLKSPGKLVAVLVALALGVTGVGIFLALRPPSEKQSNTPTPTTSPTVSQSPGQISALGRLEPAGEVFRVAPSTSSGTARIARLMVKDGSPVKRGQVIAVTDTYDRLMAAGMQAQAQVREAESRVAQVRAGAKSSEIQAQRAEIARLQEERQNALAEYNRYEQLFKAGAISQSERDRRRLTLETVTKQIDQAISQANSLVEVRPVDVQQAEAQLQVALANLQRARADLETAVVRSPIDGQVIKVHAKEGEQVGGMFSGGANTTNNCNCVAELGRTDQMYAVAEVYETDIAKIRPGQRATITSPALPNPITGRVEQIGLQIRKNDVLNTDPAADTDSRIVEVKIRLDDSKAVAGLTNLQVNVTISP